VFSLAVISYQLLTGVYPFGGKDALTAANTGVPIAPIDGFGRRQNKRFLALLRGDFDSGGEISVAAVTGIVRPLSLWASLQK
jgi:hypothetical protein